MLAKHPLYRLTNSPGAHNRNRTYTVWILSPPSLPVGVYGQTGIARLELATRELTAPCSAIELYPNKNHCCIIYSTVFAMSFIAILKSGCWPVSCLQMGLESSVNDHLHCFISLQYQRLIFIMYLCWWRYLFSKSGWQDLNLRQLVPKTSTLPNWATSRGGKSQIRTVDFLRVKQTL